MMNPENTDNLEININTPSSPLVPLQIHNFVKEINVPVEMKIQTNNTSSNMTGGGGIPTDNGIFGYFKSFFQGFSQQTLQKKKHDTQNKSYLNSLFYSGNEEKQKESESIPLEEEKTDIPIPTEEVKSESIIPPEEEKSDIPIPTEEEEQNENTEITKIILTTEDPETILRESLKGTKLYYLTERNDLPSQWV